jgi:hypothetical protein
MDLLYTTTVVKMGPLFLTRIYYVSSSCEYFCISIPDDGLRAKHNNLLVRHWMKILYIKFM